MYKPGVRADRSTSHGKELKKCCLPVCFCQACAPWKFVCRKAAPALGRDGARPLKSADLFQSHTPEGRGPLSGLRHSIWKGKNKRAPVCKVIHYNLE